MTCYDWVIKVVKAYVTNKDIQDKLEKLEDKKYNNVADNSRDRPSLLIHQIFILSIIFCFCLYNMYYSDLLYLNFPNSISISVILW